MSLKELLVCSYDHCNSIYEDARILPCGNRTCAKHIDDMLLKTLDGNEAVVHLKCYFCNEIHSLPNAQQFPRDKYVEQLLSIDHGHEHKLAKRQLNDLKAYMASFAKIETEDLVVDYFRHVEEDIETERASKTKRLNDYFDSLVDEVDERKKQCVAKLKDKKSRDEAGAIAERLELCKRKLDESNFEFDLTTLNGDDAKWKRIQSECKSLGDDIKPLVMQLQDRQIADEMIIFEPSKRSASGKDIYGRLVQFKQHNVDSVILNTVDLRFNLRKLCKLTDEQSLHLLYRASRDGFEAKAFHDKCDNQPRTLTIIKTTFGYIFGGYVEIACANENFYAKDNNAFIFSLVNPVDKPLWIPIKRDEEAVYTDALFGPTFGEDITILDESNKHNDNYSFLGHSYDFQLYSSYSYEGNMFLAGSVNFQTSDIEVFQIN